MAKKVKNVVDDKNKKEKVAKIALPKTIGQRNEKGLLTSGYVKEYDPKLHKPLGKADFADSAAFLEFRSMSLQRTADRLSESAKRMDDKAKQFRMYGDEETRRKAEKFQRLLQQAAELEKYLSDKGIAVETPAVEPTEVTTD